MNGLDRKRRKPTLGADHPDTHASPNVRPPHVEAATKPITGRGTWSERGPRPCNLREALKHIDPADRATYLDEARAGKPEPRRRLKELFTEAARSLGPTDH